MLTTNKGLLMKVLWRCYVKPGDLVRISDWDSSTMNGWNPIGLVLSHPEVKNHGTASVLVDWLESPDTEYYSVHHLDIISES